MNNPALYLKELEKTVMSLQEQFQAGNFKHAKMEFIKKHFLEKGITSKQCKDASAFASILFEFFNTYALADVTTFNKI